MPELWRPCVERAAKFRLIKMNIYIFTRKCILFFYFLEQLL
ncbi:hypothetical protein B4096_3575 [Heyndrickxia coagulans]|uniref:Uncharacterized protein n=1 Tax=Heyndrickxia coagulans TaxID=1398 RepID=A0AAN0WCR1_HEYCO|nr:hypothetical protein SB48_HM08orf04102 [Heyndrickxia coagulans]KYC89633.1 hypothetical protein B4096_3575 [Heyndrickxia coagulans]